MTTFAKIFATSLLTLSISNAFAATDTGVEHNTQAFLDALNSGGGKPMEQLTPKDARAVLTASRSPRKSS